MSFLVIVCHKQLDGVFLRFTMNTIPTFDNFGSFESY